MAHLSHNLSDWISLALLCSWAVMLLYEAWMNLVHHKLAKYSIYAFLKAIAERIGTKKSRQNAKAFPRKQYEIYMFGIWVLLAGLYEIKLIFDWITLYILH